MGDQSSVRALLEPPLFPVLLVDLVLLEDPLEKGVYLHSLDLLVMFLFNLFDLLGLLGDQSLSVTPEPFGNLFVVGQDHLDDVEDNTGYERKADGDDDG